MSARFLGIGRSAFGCAVLSAALLTAVPVHAETPTEWLAQYYQDIADGTGRNDQDDADYIAANFPQSTQAQIQGIVATMQQTTVDPRLPRLITAVTALLPMAEEATQLMNAAADGTLDPSDLDAYAREDTAAALDEFQAAVSQLTDEELTTLLGDEAENIRTLTTLITAPLLKNEDDTYALMDVANPFFIEATELLQTDPSALTSVHMDALNAQGVRKILRVMNQLGAISDTDLVQFSAASVRASDGQSIIPVMAQLDEEMSKDPPDFEAVAAIMEKDGRGIRNVVTTLANGLQPGDPGYEEAQANRIKLALINRLTRRADDGELVVTKLTKYRSLLDAIQRGDDEDGTLTEQLISLYKTHGGDMRDLLEAIVEILPEGVPGREDYVNALNLFDNMGPLLTRGADGTAPIQDPQRVGAINERLQDFSDLVQQTVGDEGLTPENQANLTRFLSDRFGVSENTVRSLLKKAAQANGGDLPPGALADLIDELINSSGLFANIDVIAGRSAIDPDLFSQDDDPSTDFTDITTGGAVSAASELVEVYFIPSGGIEGGITVFINRSTGRVGAVGTIDGGPSLPSSYVGSFAGTLNQSSGMITGLFVSHSEALEDDDLDYRQDDGMGTQGRIITTLSFPVAWFDGQTGDVTTNAIFIDPGSIPLSITNIEDTGDAGPAILLRQVPAADLVDMEREFVGYAAGLLIDRDSGGLIDSGRTTDDGRDMMVQTNVGQNTASLDIGSIFSLAGPFDIGNLTDSNIAVFSPHDFFVSEIEAPLTDPIFKSAQAGLVPGFSYVGWGRFRADLDNVDPGPPASRDQAIANISFVFGDSALSKAELPTNATANYQGPLAGSGYDASIGPEGHFDITGSVDLDVNFGADTVDGTFSIGAVGNPSPPETLNVDNGVITGDGALDFDLTGTGGFTGIDGTGEGRFFGTPGVAEEVGGSFNAGDADVTVQGVFAGQKQ